MCLWTTAHRLFMCIKSVYKKFPHPPKKEDEPTSECKQDQSDSLNKYTELNGIFVRYLEPCNSKLSYLRRYTVPKPRCSIGT